MSPSKGATTLLNRQAFTHNSTIEVQIPSSRSLAPDPTLGTLPNPSLNQSNINGVAVILPRASEVVRTEEYAVYPEDSPTPASTSPRKRKRSETLEEEDFFSRGSDQREKADATFRSLQELVQEVFEAEDQIQSPSASAPPTSEYFIVTEDDVVSLNDAIQVRLEILITKLILLRRFSQVPVDDLVRLQKLSEGSIKAAETTDVRIEDSWEEADVDSWVENLSSAESGLKSARTALRLMTGKREEKQLYSEDIILASLNAFKNIMDACMIPIVEMRPSGSTSRLFKLLSARRRDIINTLNQCRRLLSVLKDLVAIVELSETVINTLEFTVSQLIFVENAHSEKDSVLGTQKFDSLRVVAMDVLAQIFLSYPTQRRGIFDEILTSLEKLPVTKQSARQFKLVEGGSIQLVSALIMRLVQTSATKSDEGKEKRREKTFESLNGGANEDADGISVEAPNGLALSTSINAAHDTEKRAVQQAVTALQELREVISPLRDNAQKNATYVVDFIISRAMKSTKTGDAPYRNLLDLFVQDFITCLSSIDWPAAELLLRVFLIRMLKLAENEKTPAPAKNMALDVLAEMGAAISQLNSNVRMPIGTLEGADAETEVGAHLLHLADASLEGRVRVSDLVTWRGPYRAAVEYLQQRCSVDNSLQTAMGYYMAEWASQIVDSFDLISEDDPDLPQTEAEYGRMSYRLRKMITDKDWLRTEYNIQPLSIGYARLAYSLTLIGSKFCSAFEHIFRILLDCMRSEQATVRSKSLKSVNQVLETDPTILDRFKGVMRTIMECSSDSSVAVRDSALGLIGKCIGLRPNLEEEMIPGILQRVSDTGISVRKRAIKLLKDIYLRNEKKDIRSAIADALLHRVTDLDEGVQDLARQTIEEVWMQPFYLPVSAADDVSVQYRLAIADQVSLMVKTVQRRNEVSAVLDKVLQSMLSNDSKHSAANFRVCKTLVATMFETIIDNSDGRTGEARDALQLLMIFAKANAKLFTANQIQLLEPYVADLKIEDDLGRFRSIVVIFRHVFPQLSRVHSKFLESVRTTLLKAISRVGRVLLDDVVACLWIISEVLENSEHLARIAASSLKQCADFSRVGNLTEVAQRPSLRKHVKLLEISGMCGKHCNLDDQAAVFRTAFPSWRGNSVSKLMVDTFAPLAAPSQPLELRKAALDAIGMVCQSWPRNFSSVNIYTTFQQVFEEKIPLLESMIMRSFKEFLLSEEKRSDPDAEAIVGAGADTPATLGVMGGSQHDGVATEIAQKFLKDITRIALATQDDHALLATEILTSINRQGMNHPKECGPALVALETSQNANIADLAFREHRSLHEKHETILEKEYMRAVQYAFSYQRDIVKDTRGAKTNPYTAKLHLMMDVLKISKVKTRKRFFENLCSRIDFDPAKLDVSEDPPAHVDFSRFVIENMGFFEYQSIDELLIVIVAMEKIVAGTGTTIAHAIETEIFQVRLEQNSQPMILDGEELPPGPDANRDPARLRQLTAASMILSGLWEARTYLRRLHGLTTSRREGKGKVSIKDLNKAPVKVAGVTGDKFWDEITKLMSALASPEAMMDQCRNFVELLTVDKDFKIAAEGEDDITRARHTTPSEEEGDGPSAPPSGSGRGRKRKALGTPSRKKRARSSSRGRSKKVNRGSADSDDDAEGDWE